MLLELKFKLALKSRSHSDSITCTREHKGVTTSMSDDWAVKAAERVKRENESRLHAEKLEIIRAEKLLTQTVVLWEELVSISESKLAHLNENLGEGQRQITLEKKASNRIIVTNGSHPDARLEFKLEADTRSVSLTVRKWPVHGARAVESKGRYVFDVDSNGTLGLRAGNTFMLVEQAAEALLDHVLPPFK